MNAGFIRVSKELMSASVWPEIKFELDKVFTEVCRKEIGFGMVEIHGESELFESLPEGSSCEYEATINTNTNGMSVIFKRVN